MREQIFIRDLEVYGYHGVYIEEREKGQIFRINLDCDIDMQAALASDDIEDTVNYGMLCFYIRDYFQKHTFQLLETVADGLCHDLLLDFPAIRGITLEVGKPNAPIQMDFGNVGVRMERRWHRVALSIGSNMGDKKDYLLQGVMGLKSIAEIKNVVESDIYLTAPYGYMEQEDFFNMAVVMDSFLSPPELLKRIQEIEQAAGRTREIHWGPRTLDIDILLYDDIITADQELIIPHADMCNRMFVLQPLAQIAPGMVHPLSKKRIAELLGEKTKEEGASAQEIERISLHDS